MSMHAAATRAYAAAQNLRSQREQEADLFRRANAALRQAGEPGSITSVRALADTSRLWTAVIDLVRDPQNALPEPLKASIVAVGRAVQRELESPAPDLDFLMSVNDDLAVGLAGRG